MGTDADLVLQIASFTQASFTTTTIITIIIDFI